MIVSPIVNYPAGGVMFIDADLRAMIVARFELVGTEETPGVPDTPAGLAAARSSALRELVRDQRGIPQRLVAAPFTAARQRPRRTGDQRRPDGGKSPGREVTGRRRTGSPDGRTTVPTGRGV